MTSSRYRWKNRRSRKRGSIRIRIIIQFQSSNNSNDNNSKNMPNTTIALCYYLELILRPGVLGKGPKLKSAKVWSLTILC